MFGGKFPHYAQSRPDEDDCFNKSRWYDGTSPLSRQLKTKCKPWCQYLSPPSHQPRKIYKIDQCKFLHGSNSDFLISREKIPTTSHLFPPENFHNVNQSALKFDTLSKKYRDHYLNIEPGFDQHRFGGLRQKVELSRNSGQETGLSQLSRHSKGLSMQGVGLSGLSRHEVGLSRMSRHRIGLSRLSGHGAGLSQIPGHATDMSASPCRRVKGIREIDQSASSTNIGSGGIGHLFQIRSKRNTDYLTHEVRSAEKCDERNRISSVSNNKQSIKSIHSKIVQHSKRFNKLTSQTNIPQTSHDDLSLMKPFQRDVLNTSKESNYQKADNDVQTAHNKHRSIIGNSSCDHASQATARGGTHKNTRAPGNSELGFRKCLDSGECLTQELGAGITGVRPASVGSHGDVVKDTRQNIARCGMKSRLSRLYFDCQQKETGLHLPRREVYSDGVSMLSSTETDQSPCTYRSPCHTHFVDNENYSEKNTRSDDKCSEKPNSFDDNLHKKRTNDDNYTYDRSSAPDNDRSKRHTSPDEYRPERRATPDCYNSKIHTTPDEYMPDNKTLSGATNTDCHQTESDSVIRKIVIYEMFPNKDQSRQTESKDVFHKSARKLVDSVQTVRSKVVGFGNVSPKLYNDCNSKDFCEIKDNRKTYSKANTECIQEKPCQSGVFHQSTQTQSQSVHAFEHKQSVHIHSKNKEFHRSQIQPKNESAICNDHSRCVQTKPCNSIGIGICEPEYTKSTQTQCDIATQIDSGFNDPARQNLHLDPAGDQSNSEYRSPSTHNSSVQACQICSHIRPNVQNSSKNLRVHGGPSEYPKSNRHHSESGNRDQICDSSNDDYSKSQETPSSDSNKCSYSGQYNISKSPAELEILTNRNSRAGQRFGRQQDQNTVHRHERNYHKFNYSGDSEHKRDFSDLCDHKVKYSDKGHSAIRGNKRDKSEKFSDHSDNQCDKPSDDDECETDPSTLYIEIPEYSEYSDFEGVRRKEPRAAFVKHKKCLAEPAGDQNHYKSLNFVFVDVEPDHHEIKTLKDKFATSPKVKLNNPHKDYGSSSNKFKEQKSKSPINMSSKNTRNAMKLPQNTHNRLTSSQNAHETMTASQKTQENVRSLRKQKVSADARELFNIIKRGEAFDDNYSEQLIHLVSELVSEHLQQSDDGFSHLSSSEPKPSNGTGSVTFESDKKSVHFEDDGNNFIASNQPPESSHNDKSRCQSHKIECWTSENAPRNCSNSKLVSESAVDRQGSSTAIFSKSTLPLNVREYEDGMPQYDLPGIGLGGCEASPPNYNISGQKKSLCYTEAYVSSRNEAVPAQKSDCFRKRKCLAWERSSCWPHEFQNTRERRFPPHKLAFNPSCIPRTAGGEAGQQLSAAWETSRRHLKRSLDSELWGEPRQEARGQGRRRSRWWG